MAADYLSDRIMIVVPANRQAASNLFGELIDSDTGGALTFTSCALSASGALPATHYAASMQIRRPIIQAIKAGGAAILAKIKEERPASTITLTQVNAFLSNVSIIAPQRVIDWLAQQPGGAILGLVACPNDEGRDAKLARIGLKRILT
jgi:hypothetical protein